MWYRYFCLYQFWHVNAFIFCCVSSVKKIKQGCCHIAPSCCGCARSGCSPRPRPCPSSRRSSGTLPWTARTAAEWWQWWGTRKKAPPRRTLPPISPRAPLAASVTSGSSSAPTSVSEGLTTAPFAWSSFLSVLGEVQQGKVGLNDSMTGWRVGSRMTDWTPHPPFIPAPPPLFLFYQRGISPLKNKSGVFWLWKACFWGILCSRPCVSVRTEKRDHEEEGGRENKEKLDLGGGNRTKTQGVCQ